MFACYCPCAECAFVLVAGGLGERLGYSGIKVALPTESATGTCYLQLYAESILALQARAGGACGPLPLAIMTSDDTHDRTLDLLAANSQFGLRPEQVWCPRTDWVGNFFFPAQGTACAPKLHA